MTLAAALAAERRATVERIRERLTATPVLDPLSDVLAILDEEGDPSTEPWLDVDRLAKALAATYQATFPLAEEGDWQSDAKFIAAEYGLAAPSSENEAAI